MVRYLDSAFYAGCVCVRESVSVCVCVNINGLLSFLVSPVHSKISVSLSTYQNECLCVSMCVCVWRRKRDRRWGGRTDRLICMDVWNIFSQLHLNLCNKLISWQRFEPIKKVKCIWLLPLDSIKGHSLTNFSNFLLLL